MKTTPLSLRRLIDVADRLVDDHVGIVRHVQEVPIESGDPNFFHFSGQACNTAAFCRQENFGSTGGASTDRAIAVAKAIGEAVERYCAALYEVGELPLASYEDAEFQCVRPDEFAFYSAEQYERPGFPWVPFLDDTPIRWAAAIDPLTGETWHVPAALVYIPYAYYLGTGDAPIVQPISTGVACHTGFARAAGSAICEVIERDAFTITWQARLGTPQIRIETLSNENYNLVERFERTGGFVTILNITTDVGIPTILSLLRYENDNGPALVVAASTDLNPEVAVRKSLEELAHTRRYAQQIKSRMPRLEPDPEYSNVVDQLSHLNFWSDHANMPLSAFLYESKERIDFNEIENRSVGDPIRDLQVLIDAVDHIGHRVLLADLTTPDVGDLGLSVVRAVIPGFHPLFMGHEIRALGGRRLWEVPQRLGYRGVDRATGDNPLPHPYP